MPGRKRPRPCTKSCLDRRRPDRRMMSLRRIRRSRMRNIWGIGSRLGKKSNSELNSATSNRELNDSLSIQLHFGDDCEQFIN